MLSLLAAVAAVSDASARAAPSDAAFDALEPTHRSLSALTWPGSEHTRTPLHGAPQRHTYLAPGGSYCGYESTPCCDGRCVSGLTCYSGACGAASAPPADTKCGGAGEQCCTAGDACQTPMICRVDSEDGIPKCITAAATAESTPEPAAPDEPCPSVASVLRDRPGGDLATFMDLIEASDLSSTLKSSDTLTVFAPSNEAWASLGDATLKALHSDTATTKQAREPFLARAVCVAFAFDADCCAWTLARTVACCAEVGCRACTVALLAQRSV